MFTNPWRGKTANEATEEAQIVINMSIYVILPYVPFAYHRIVIILYESIDEFVFDAQRQNWTKKNGG